MIKICVYVKDVFKHITSSLKDMPSAVFSRVKGEGRMNTMVGERNKVQMGRGEEQVKSKNFSFE